MAAPAQLRRVLITGANKGIGYHMAEQLVSENADMYVYLGSRSQANGDAAVQQIVEKNPEVADRISCVSIDVSSMESITSAKTIVAEGGMLWALVNNAGVGAGDVEFQVGVNTYGSRQTTEAFLDLMVDNGRVVFTSSAAGPMFLNKCDEAVQRKYIDMNNFTWEEVDELLSSTIAAFKEGGEDQLRAYLSSQGCNSDSAYGLSKFGLNCYCQMLAKRENPKNLVIAAYTPGFLATALVNDLFSKDGKTGAEMGARPPSEGTASMKHCLFNDLGGNGYYFGSDCVRSPLHIYRGRGDAPYNGGFEWSKVEKPKLRFVDIPNLGPCCDMCMGTMTLTSQVPEDNDCFAIMDSYVAAGGNFIDTAELYPIPMNPKWMGDTELMLGRWFQTGTVDRSSVILATKIGGYTPMDAICQSRGRALNLDESEIFPNSEINAAQIRQAVDASLARLQTDYIDLYQVHWPSRYTPIWGKSEYKQELINAHQHFPALDRVIGPEYYEEAVRTFGELIEEGKIRAWGLSNETSFGVFQWCETAKRLGVQLPSTIQNDFGLCDRRFETELAETCTQYGVKLICYGALNGGFLSDKYFRENPVTTGSRHTDFAPAMQVRYAEKTKTRPAAIKYYELAQRKGLALEQMAYAWARSRFYMGSVIIGVSSLEQTLANMEIGAYLDLDEETLREIDTIHFYHPNPNVGELPTKEEKETGLSLQKEVKAEK